MRFLLYLLTFCWTSSLLGQNGDYFVYISSVSSENQAGIILLDFDTKTGETVELNRFSSLHSTSYLNISPDGRYLYSIYSGKNGQGALSGFSINPEDGNLTLVNTRENIGKGPCYISVANSGKSVLVANYVQGNVLSFQKKRNGKIGKLVSNT